jgi:hypothetical protein
MQTSRFDALTRSWSRLLSRRSAAGVLGLSTLTLTGFADARKRSGKKKKRPKFNDFGCVNVGGFCKSDRQCCSGICEGKKRKKRCRAHDTGGCQEGQDNCEGIPIRCLNGTSDGGLCLRTTGKAGYCFGIFVASQCMDCRKDADCVPFCGPQAACVVCPSCGGSEFQTACVGPVEGSCVFN